MDVPITLRPPNNIEITIEVDPDSKAWIDKLMLSGRYNSVSAYCSGLIRHDQARETAIIELQAIVDSAFHEAMSSVGVQATNGTRTYRVTASAARDLRSILDATTETHDSKSAVQYLKRLCDVLDLVANNPDLGRPRPETNPPVHCHPHERHVVLYVVDMSGIVVLRILGGWQNWQHVLSS